jgi:glutaredoxin
MMATAIIYTTDDCERCEHVKNVLRAFGIEFEERSAKEWLTGQTVRSDWRNQRLVECRAVLALHNDQLPVIDSQGDEQLKARLIEVWKANPIPRCREGMCQLGAKDDCGK